MRIELVKRMFPSVITRVVQKLSSVVEKSQHIMKSVCRTHSGSLSRTWYLKRTQYYRFLSLYSRRYTGFKNRVSGRRMHTFTK